MASTVLGSRLLPLAHRRDDCFGSGKLTGNKPLWVSAKVYRYSGIPVELLRNLFIPDCDGERCDPGCGRARPDAML